MALYGYLVSISWQIQMKKRRKLNDSNVWEVAYPNTIIGLFKMKFACQAFI